MKRTKDTGNGVLFLSEKSVKKSKTSLRLKKGLPHGILSAKERDGKIMAKKNSGNGGRKSKYPEVQKRIPEIMAWRRQDGLSEKEVAAKLGIAPSTLEKYKTEHEEFRDALKEAKQAIISDVFSALLKRAKGYTYEEKKVYTRHEDGDLGGKTVTYTEITSKQEPPNVAACSLLLKNLDKDHGWSDNPQMLEIKKQEQELRKQLAESEQW